MVERRQQSSVEVDMERWVGGVSLGNRRCALWLGVSGSLSSASQLLVPLLFPLLLDELLPSLSLILYINDPLVQG